MFIPVTSREGLIYFGDKLHAILVEASIEPLTDKGIDTVLQVREKELKRLTAGVNRFLKMKWTPKDFIMYAYNFDENGRAIRQDIYQKVWNDQRNIMRKFNKYRIWLYDEEIHDTESISEFKLNYPYTKEVAKVCRCEHYKAYRTMVDAIETRAKELNYI